jgi:alkylated DNA repair dioxygenase AlkB
MDILFPAELKLPEGFFYQPDFLTEKEERDLLHEISGIRLHTFLFQGFEAKRKVKSFGYDYSFDKKSLSEGESIPSVFHPIIKKVADLLSLATSDFAELLLTEYPIGSVINWHRDAPPFELIAGISLRSDCTFRLRPQEKAKQSRSSIISFPVKRRSLYVMQGPARSDWQHSISPVKQVRYSITLRTLRK